MSEINKAAILAEYQRAKGDTGSPEVQVALLTARINSLTDHFKTRSLYTAHSNFDIKFLSLIW
mgnify:CR=1 FL=1